MFKTQKQQNFMMKNLPKVAGKMIGDMPKATQSSTESKATAKYHADNAPMTGKAFINFVTRGKSGSYKL